MAKQRKMTWFLVALGGLAVLLFPAARARAACCLDACPSPSIIACTSVGCPTDVVPNCPGQIVAESPDPAATCGVGNYTTCPNSEDGSCTDGVNNDAWLDDLTDCADPDCFNDPACCGGPGQRCCQTAPCVSPMVGECDDPGLVCSPDIMCVACGGLSEPCCLLPGAAGVQAVCNAGFACGGQTAIANGTCNALSTAPTLSPAALACAGLLLLALGAWHMRRRADR
jgi:hypothetical protein